MTNLLQIVVMSVTLVTNVVPEHFEWSKDRVGGATRNSWNLSDIMLSVTVVPAKTKIVQRTELGMVEQRELYVNHPMYDVLDASNGKTNWMSVPVFTGYVSITNSIGTIEKEVKP